MIPGAVYITRPSWGGWQGWAAFAGQIVTRRPHLATFGHVVLATGRDEILDVAPGYPAEFDIYDPTKDARGPVRVIVPPPLHRVHVLDLVDNLAEAGVFQETTYSFLDGILAGLGYSTRPDGIGYSCGTFVATLYAMTGHPLLPKDPRTVLPVDLARIATPIERNSRK